MTMQLQPMTILLNPDEEQLLIQIAAQEGRSPADVASDILHQQLERRLAAAADLTHYLAGLEEIRRHNAALLAENDGQPLDWDVVEEINQARDERDEYILNLGTDRR